MRGECGLTTGYRRGRTKRSIPIHTHQLDSGRVGLLHIIRPHRNPLHSRTGSLWHVYSWTWIHHPHQDWQISGNRPKDRLIDYSSSMDCATLDSSEDP